MAYTFTPPTYLEANPNAGVLFSRYNIPRGYTIVVTGSTVEQVTTPGNATWNTADFVYQGGHEYTITDAEAAVLIAAGYTPEAV